MAQFPDAHQLHDLERRLTQERSLPGKRPEADRIVYWHVFRRPEDALDFARNILLEDDEHLVGGYTRDSIGAMWWVGVQVGDLTAWGNRQAVHKIGRRGT